MDPKENTNPSVAGDAQTNTPGAAAPIDATQTTSDNSAPSLSPDVSSAAPGDSNQGATPAVDVDLPASPVASTSSSDAPSVADDNLSDNLSAPATDAVPTETAFNTDPAQPSIASEAPITPPADPSASIPDASAAPDLGLGSDPTTVPGMPEAPPSEPNTTPDIPTLTPDQPAGGLAPTVPVPAHGTDKKTIIILGVIAVVLIATILVLFFK